LQRLKTRLEFQTVLAGRVLARTTHFAWHCAALDALLPRSDAGTRYSTTVSSPVVDPGVSVGALVPKRWAKRAVTRNTIRRQIYSMSRDFESRMSIAAHVVRLRAGFKPDQFVSASSAALKAAIRLELQQLFAQAAAGTPVSKLSVSRA
jgi:ribonuclease P protein component